MSSILPWFSLMAVAHGPPAAVLGVASFDAVGPVHVVLTEGLGVRLDGGWQYVCPTRWGGVPAAPFVAGGPSEVLLPGADDLYRVDGSGLVEPMGETLFSVEGLLDLDGGAAGVWGIWLSDGGRLVAHLDSGLSAPGEVGWSGVLGRPDGADLVAAEAGQLRHRRIDFDGDILADEVLFPLVGTSPQLVGSGETSWVVDRASGYVGVTELATGEEVGQGVASSAGPLRVGEAVFVAIDGLMYRQTESGLVRTAEKRPVSCLEGGAGASWGCSRDLYAVSPTGELDAVIVALDVLRPPDVTGLDADGGVACWGEWRTFALDLGLDPGTLPSDTTGDAAVVAEGTCSATPAAFRVPLGLAILLTVRFRQGTVRGPAAEAGGGSPPRR